MRLDFTKRPLILAVLAAGIAGCDNSLTQPRGLDASNAASDRTPARPQPTRPQTPDTATRRRCRADNELTEREIAEIRALYNAYQDEIADDLRLIAKVEQEAREAAAAGASREKIAAILARADEAKKHVAEATERLRAAISEILHDDEPPCFVLINPTGSLSS
jgi:hypothetical protein